MAIDLNSKPHSLTHIQNMSYDEDNQLAIREIVGVDPNGVIRKVPVTTDGTLAVSQDVSLPTAGNNPEIVIDSSDPNNVVLTKTIGSTDYTKTISTSGSSTTISPWSEA